MYISEKLVYTELHKTAGSHIGNLLHKYVPGEQVGKHNRIPLSLRNRFVLGSIRNPWDWYVSLWGYGCDSRGSVFTQTTRKFCWEYYTRQLPREMGGIYMNPLTTLKQLANDVAQPTQTWQRLYSDSKNVDNFREWLSLMMDSKRALDIGEGYGFSPIAEFSGILTYRFFKLFTGLDKDIYSAECIKNQQDLAALWEQHKFVDSFVRQENLESDFVESLKKANIILTPEQQEAIFKQANTKTNTSSRNQASYYYDQKSIDLIAEREQFIINLFNYSFDSTK